MHISNYLIGVWIHICFVGAEGIVDWRGSLARDMCWNNWHRVHIEMGIKPSIVKAVAIFAKAADILFWPGWIISSEIAKGQKANNAKNDENWNDDSDDDSNLISGFFVLRDRNGVDRVAKTSVVTSRYIGRRSKITPTYKIISGMKYKSKWLTLKINWIYSSKYVQTNVLTFCAVEKTIIKK